MRIASMDSKIQNIDLLRSFILKLTDSDIYEIEKISLTSAQKSRIASWCDENNIEIPDLSNESFWRTGLNSNNKAINLITDSNSNILIGIDIQCISEFLNDKKHFSKLDEDLQSIFTKRELSYAESKENPRHTLTGIFAAKEEIFKSKNIEIKKWNELEIKHEDNIPSFKNFSLSISHSGNFAIAVAVASMDLKISSNNSYKPSNDSSRNILHKFISYFGILGGLLFILSSLGLIF